VGTPRAVEEQPVTFVLSPDRRWVACRGWPSSWRGSSACSCALTWHKSISAPQGCDDPPQGQDSISQLIGPKGAAWND